MCGGLASHNDAHYIGDSDDPGAKLIPKHEHVCPAGTVGRYASLQKTTTARKSIGVSEIYVFGGDEFLLMRFNCVFQESNSNWKFFLLYKHRSMVYRQNVIVLLISVFFRGI